MAQEKNIHFRTGTGKQRGQAVTIKVGDKVLQGVTAASFERFGKVAVEGKRKAIQAHILNDEYIKKLNETKVLITASAIPTLEQDERGVGFIYSKEVTQAINNLNELIEARIEAIKAYYE